MSQKCRFCLKNFCENEVYFGITEEIKEMFESLSETKFVLSKKLKNLICELCKRSLQVTTLLKNQFIQNQIKFLAEENHIKSYHINDIQPCSSGSYKREITNVNKTIGLKIVKTDMINNTENFRQNPVARPHFIVPRPVPRQSYPQPLHIPKYSLSQAVNRPKLTLINPATNPKLILQHPVTKLEPVRKESYCQPSSKVVDKILLKFEKIDRSSDKIIGTDNIKTIKKSKRKRRLTTKALELIKEEEVNFKCPFCEKIFTIKTLLNAHIAADHNAQILECKVCSTIMFNKRDLNDHINQFHQQERNFGCTMCPKAYASKATLKKHIATKHPNSKYRCNYKMCYQTFDRFDAVRSHMVSEHPEVKFKDMFSCITKVET